MLCVPYVHFHILVRFGYLLGHYLEIAAHSAYDMFSKYMNLFSFVNLVFSHLHLGFLSGIDCK